MKIPITYWYKKSSCVFRLIHIHTGMNDKSLVWIVNGWILDIFFMKLQTNYNFKKLYINGSFLIFNKYNLYELWNNLMFKLYKYYTKKLPKRA